MARRSTQIQVRLTEDEKAELEAKARLHGLTVSAYLRAAGLQRDTSGGIGNILSRSTGVDVGGGEVVRGSDTPTAAAPVTTADVSAEAGVGGGNDDTGATASKPAVDPSPEGDVDGSGGPDAQPASRRLAEGGAAAAVDTEKKKGMVSRVFEDG